jgi:hypothetical protein
MLKTKVEAPEDLNPVETTEWIEALEQIIDEEGPDRASYLLQQLLDRASHFGVTAPLRLNTPYMNTVPPHEEAPYPGDRAVERRIKSLVRWNAMAMVVRANKYDPNIGGHISTYASLATLTEVGLNHIFKARYDDQPGDFIYFQGTLAGHVRARVSGRPPHGAAPREFPSRTARASGVVVLSAPVADAQLLAVPDGVDGTGPDRRHLPGALHAVPGKPRRHSEDRAQGVRVPGRRRDGRTRVAGRD